MENWIGFWTAVLALGLGAYFLVVVAVIPLGARDIRRLFARLDAPESQPDHNKTDEEQTA